MMQLERQFPSSGHLVGCLQTVDCNKSFNHEKYENETELSKYVWKLKKKNSNLDAVIMAHSKLICQELKCYESFSEKMLL